MKRQKVSIILFFALKNLEIIQRPAQFLDLMKEGISLISSCSRTTDSRHGFERGLCDSISHDIDVMRSLLVNTTRLCYFRSCRCLYISRRYWKNLNPRVSPALPGRLFSSLAAAISDSAIGTCFAPSLWLASRILPSSPLPSIALNLVFWVSLLPAKFYWGIPI